MLKSDTYATYLALLKSELVSALGCTEPIAVAYAAAVAVKTLGKQPERAELWCSGNIVKNVKGVIVPNTGKLKGIDAAAIAGIVGGDPDKGLQVLESVKVTDYDNIRSLLASGMCRTHLIEGEETLYIIAKVYAGKESAEVYIKDSHTNIFKIVKNAQTVFEKEDGIQIFEGIEIDRNKLNVRDILAFADTVALSDVSAILSAQIEKNTAISEEGLRGQYGVNVGKMLLKCFGNDIKTRAKARAAAGSDARMSGCSLPVVINSGSGNQGMTVSLPVIAFAEELKLGKEKLYRALVVSNLIAIHQKTSIGKLSAYCGAVSAACGSGAAITYMSGGTYEEISATITNTLANVGGIVCDGAKPSCAAKIASAVDAAIMAHYLSAEGLAFSDGEGLVSGDVEGTIANIGRMGGIGMRSTDAEILKMMVG
ncbi:MAG: L-serine ammonia-lyase, iron-sulfur-dependent, subunit alpha [Treponemataceae bacterium]